MIRGGIWQRPRRPALCLLYRSRQRPTGFSLRAYSEGVALKDEAKEGLPNGRLPPLGSDPVSGFNKTNTPDSPRRRRGIRPARRGPLDELAPIKPRNEPEPLEPRNGLASLMRSTEAPVRPKIGKDSFWDWAEERDSSRRNSRSTSRRQELRPQTSTNSSRWSALDATASLGDSRRQDLGTSTKSTGWGALEAAVGSAEPGKKKKKKNAAGLDDSISPEWDWAADYVTKKSSRKDVWSAEPARYVPEPSPQTYTNPQDDWAKRKKERERRRMQEIEESSRKAKRSGGRDRGRDDEDDDFDPDEYEERRRQRLARREEKARLERERLNEPTPILLPELISVTNLGTALGVEPDLFLRQLGELGFEDISKDSIFTGETAGLVALEYGFNPTVATGEGEDLKPRPPAEDPSTVPPRPPVVTIMGHVDHGKTTLLDYLRKSSIVSQEHGGITQHIGAFSVQMSSGKQITFLDTPGHAAFLTMRQRGANVTDIVILVVAADDSVKPQTLEALKHAQAAKVPIIVAINKIDKDSANIERVKSDLAKHGVELEDYGGDVQSVCVSGKTGQGMDDLEENILLLAEMLDIRAETDGMAEGWVLESSIKPVGRAATVLIKRGTLRVGDFIIAGTAFAKVRTLRNEAGEELESAPPGTAVEILGWKDLPDAGDQVLQAPTEDRAKVAISYREEIKERHDSVAQQTQLEQDRREKAATDAAAEDQTTGKRRGEMRSRFGVEEAESSDASSGIKTVNFTIKGDVHGSVEAVCAAVLEQGNNEVRPRVLQSTTGQITEWDVEHAAVSGSTILNFNLPVPAHIKSLADAQGVKILEHNVIYHLTEEVRDVLASLLAPKIVVKVVAEAEILQVFPINVKGRVYKNVAGCKVRNGQITRQAKVRVMRGGEQIFEGTMESLKQGKKEANEIKKGSECGIMFDSDWQDFRQGDQIQAIEEIREKRTL
ncbi:hypothetical protein QBC47DRAFT_378657 [Echria macrotheca]|uniref:Translation initiation factor IF-2, mitochondrial n=1 Tax=Echria macrotheca TaxID=438768 RepID=A0AAJ0F7U0_9PEZI|nr:hypothetical protein QBC47DRAFT_378657 [Echria macrotheca]